MPDAAWTAAIERLATAVEITNERMDALTKAVLAEPTPSPVVPLLQDILASLARIEAVTVPAPNGKAHG